MKLSVVTAVWNRRETIAASVESTQTQSWPDREHVIQDGGSTDGTLELLQDLADHRTVLVSEPDDGIYDAINRGIQRASGDAIGLMHSDDFFAHDRVLERVAEALSDPEVDGVYGDLEYVSAADPSRRSRSARAPAGAGVRTMVRLPAAARSAQAGGGDMS